MGYKEEIGDWLGWLLLWIVALLAMIMLAVVIIFSPIAAALNRIKKALAMAGLKSEQKGLLTELSRYRMPLLHRIAQELSDNEDYFQTQRSSAEGYAVLSVKERIRKLRKADIEKLINACRKVNIAEWRIRLVKPEDT